MPRARPRVEQTTFHRPGAADYQTTATRLAVGATSLSSSIRLAAISSVEKRDAGEDCRGRARAKDDPARQGYRLRRRTQSGRAIACINECPDDVSPTPIKRSGFCADQLAGQLGQPRRLRVGIAKRHIDVASLDEAALRERIPQCLVDASLSSERTGNTSQPIRLHLAAAEPGPRAATPPPRRRAAR